MKKQKIKIDLVHLGDEGCHIFCKAKIDGKKARVLIDTGASKTVLSKEFANGLKRLKYLELPEENGTAGIGPEKIEAQFARIKSIQFKKLNIKKLVVGTIDVTHVKQLYENLNIKPFDLILGGEVLEKYNAHIDYKNRILLLG
ncbi:MAG: clan AA aspartic protease [Bacteroidia bacterium]|nr:clan AA aspartic protease [Bacteroidia bacterium]